MKKKGFTLSEVLIAVSIIGVMAALMASAFNHAKPDKAKMLYLKAYDALTTAVGAMVNDSSLFAENIELNGQEYNIEYTPLFDTSQPSNPYYYNDSVLRSNPGNKKFARILFLMLKGEIYATAGATTTFRTGPGDMRWTVIPDITPLTSDPTVANAKFEVNLTIDNDNDRPFSFCIQPNGEVQAMDARGKRYIANRMSVHDNDQPFTPDSCTAKDFSITTSGTSHIVNDD